MTKEKTYTIIGIDIGSQKTKIVAAAHSNIPKSYPKILQTEEIDSEGVFHGNIVDEKEVADLIFAGINMLNKNIQKEAKHIILSLNASGINSVWNSASILNTNLNGEITELDIKRLEEEAEKAVTNIKNRKRIHTVPIKYKIDQNEVQGSPIHMIGKRLEGKFLFVSCPILYVEKLENIMNSLNLEIDDIIAGPFAECSLLLSKKEKMAGVALINLGHSTTSVLVYENNNPLLLTILPYGSNDITNDIALGLQISLEEAEDIKCGRSSSSVSKRKLEEIIESRVADICEKINIELEKINRKELLPGGIILCGGGSELLRIDYLFKYNLKLPIKFANEELIKKTDRQLADTNFARAMGLTYFAPIISEEYMIKKYFKDILKTILNYLKKFLP